MFVEIFDPAMCCASGVCGPTLDPELIAVNDTIMALKKQGVRVERYNLSQQLKSFMDNKIVAELIHRNGKKSLPITLINGTVFKSGAYASYEALCEALGIEPLRTLKPMTLPIMQA